MLLWLLKRSEDNARFHQNHLRCNRCGLYYKKQFADCSHCSGLSDADLGKAIKQRKKFRLSLGRGMMIGAMVFVVVMIAAAFQLA